jgi:hypothetical protein
MAKDYQGRQEAVNSVKASSEAAPHTSMQLSGGLEAQFIHIIVTGALVVLIFFFIGFGAAVVMLLSGYLAAIKAPRAVDFAAPGMGTLERLTYYSYLLWILVFAALRLRAKPHESAGAGTG